MKKIKIIALSLFSLTGCMTLSGNYEVQAFDENGTQLQGPRMISQGSGIYTAKNVLCQIHPNASIKVINLDQNIEVKNEARHCQNSTNTKPVPTQSTAQFEAPKNFTFSDSNYQLIFQNSDTIKATYEYTTHNETVNNWSKLLTIHALKNSKLSAQQYANLQMNQLQKAGFNQNPQLSSQHDAIYLSVTYLPTDLKSKNLMASTYEVNVQKIFAQCKPLITLSIAERLPADKASLETTLQKTRDTLMTQLAANPWKPFCS
ncbi:hypothetical protein G9F32_01785 [Acinetobacter sp. 194]|uniref:hypothetical protein n=1 Tax=Acinetobacter shaoyimingii TaxID=2715164 RepID=UPI00140C0371|nr:hypothetical protein [Acinetobacter shaoyimingii]NHB56771.1 hypothetical protein [Acinetobacter shaoyimingii]